MRMGVDKGRRPNANASPRRPAAYETPVAEIEHEAHHGRTVRKAEVVSAGGNSISKPSETLRATSASFFNRNVSCEPTRRHGGPGADQLCVRLSLPDPPVTRSTFAGLADAPRSCVWPTGSHGVRSLQADASLTQPPEIFSLLLWGSMCYAMPVAAGAQTCSLLYRRFLTCQSPPASNVLAITNRRYGGDTAD